MSFKSRGITPLTKVFHGTAGNFGNFDSFDLYYKRQPSTPADEARAIFFTTDYNKALAHANRKAKLVNQPPLVITAYIKYAKLYDATSAIRVNRHKFQTYSQTKRYVYSSIDLNKYDAVEIRGDDANTPEIAVFDPRIIHIIKDKTMEATDFGVTSAWWITDKGKLLEVAREHDETALPYFPEIEKKDTYKAIDRALKAGWIRLRAFGESFKEQLAIQLEQDCLNARTVAAFKKFMLDFDGLFHIVTTGIYLTNNGEDYKRYEPYTKSSLSKIMKTMVSNIGKKIEASAEPYGYWYTSEGKAKPVKQEDHEVVVLDYLEQDNTRLSAYREWEKETGYNSAVTYALYELGWIRVVTGKSLNIEICVQNVSMKAYVSMRRELPNLDFVNIVFDYSGGDQGTKHDTFDRNQLPAMFKIVRRNVNPDLDNNSMTASSEYGYWLHDGKIGEVEHQAHDIYVRKHFSDKKLGAEPWAHGFKQGWIRAVNERNGNLAIELWYDFVSRGALKALSELINKRNTYKGFIVEINRGTGNTVLPEHLRKRWFTFKEDEEKQVLHLVRQCLNSEITANDDEPYGYWITDDGQLLKVDYEDHNGVADKYIHRHFYKEYLEWVQENDTMDSTEFALTKGFVRLVAEGEILNVEIDKSGIAPKAYKFLSKFYNSTYFDRINVDVGFQRRTTTSKRFSAYEDDLNKFLPFIRTYVKKSSLQAYDDSEDTSVKVISTVRQNVRKDKTIVAIDEDNNVTGKYTQIAIEKWQPDDSTDQIQLLNIGQDFIIRNITQSETSDLVPFKFVETARKALLDRVRDMEKVGVIYKKQAIEPIQLYSSLAKMSLEEFINSPLKNAYIKEFGLKSYYSKGPRYINGVTYKNVLTRANTSNPKRLDNIEVNNKKKSTGKYRLLDNLTLELAKKYNFDGIYVEFVLNQFLGDKLLSYGYALVNSSLGTDNYFKKLSNAMEATDDETIIKRWETTGGKHAITLVQDKYGYAINNFILLPNNEYKKDGTSYLGKADLEQALKKINEQLAVYKNVDGSGFKEVRVSKVLENIVPKKQAEKAAQVTVRGKAQNPLDGFTKFSKQPDFPGLSVYLKKVGSFQYAKVVHDSSNLALISLTDKPLAFSPTELVERLNVSPLKTVNWLLGQDQLFKKYGPQVLTGMVSNFVASLSMKKQDKTDLELEAGLKGFVKDYIIALYLKRPAAAKNLQKQIDAVIQKKGLNKEKVYFYYGNPAIKSEETWTKVGLVRTGTSSPYKYEFADKVKPITEEPVKTVEPTPSDKPKGGMVGAYVSGIDKFGNKITGILLTQKTNPRTHKTEGTAVILDDDVPIKAQLKEVRRKLVKPPADLLKAYKIISAKHRLESHDLLATGLSKEELKALNKRRPDPSRGHHSYRLKIGSYCEAKIKRKKQVGFGYGRKFIDHVDTVKGILVKENSYKNGGVASGGLLMLDKVDKETGKQNFVVNEVTGIQPIFRKPPTLLKDHYNKLAKAGKIPGGKEIK